ncbi:CRISPR-associated protein Cas4 [Castellaniella sp.]|uniref:CRISPR-associated protein Cas4 n=1 Tax=Castellaniella sp. TaxID=1955812 RepID=UPI003C75E733
MDDEDLLPLSALQHYLYCPRQCALIHLEQQWAENRLTAEGRLLHQRADTPQIERRRGVRTVTAMPLLSLELGITGTADVVEFHRGETGERAFPVEYKRGRPKAHRADEVQLCAQALCLEAMLGVPVEAGALFYGKTRRRKEVPFDPELRDLTQRTIIEVRTMIASRQTPSACYEAKRCDACSLLELCQPRLLGRRSVGDWLRRQIDEKED